MSDPSGPPVRVPVFFDDDAAWRRWLEEHESSADEVWLALAKKGSPRATVTYGEAVDVALCFGWIDSHKVRYDDHFSLQRFSRRSKRSIWSKINQDRVARLVAEGRMTPTGLAEVERAKADGRWEAAYAPPSSAEPPAALVAALAENPVAEAAFSALDKTNRYAIIFRLGNVKRADTLARKIDEYVAMLERGETIHPRRRPRAAAGESTPSAPAPPTDGPAE